MRGNVSSGLAVSNPDLPDHHPCRAEKRKAAPVAGAASLSRHAICRKWRQSQAAAAKDYRFFRAAVLAAAACFFCCSALLALDCFCEDFFWVALGDLSPMGWPFNCALTGLRNLCFPAVGGSLRMAEGNVNDGRKEKAAPVSRGGW